MKKRLKILIPMALALVPLSVWALWTGLTVRAYEVPTEKVTEKIRIVLLTDLHSTVHGGGQSKLIAKIREQAPDLILLSGDIADDETPIEGTKLLLTVIGREYPCFYVTGNHEFWSGEVESIKELFRSYGVTVLEGTGETVEVNGQKVLVCGVDDPNSFETFFGQTVSPGWADQLAGCEALLDGETFSVLLSHRPERVEDYEVSGFDLVVSGHAHGGQVRIPGLLNGLLAPHQGFFPKYAGGQYHLGGTELVVSRGLSINPRLPRVFNPPEVVVIDIYPRDLLPF